MFRIWGRKPTPRRPARLPADLLETVFDQTVFDLKTRPRPVLDADEVHAIEADMDRIAIVLATTDDVDGRWVA